MRDLWKKAGKFWENILFDDRTKFSLWRIAGAFAMAVLLIADPFCAAGWFRYFLVFLLAGAIVSVLANVKNKKAMIFAFLLAVMFFCMIWFGRGDSVSGYGMAALLTVSGIGLLKFKRTAGYSGKNLILRISCAAAAFGLAAVMLFSGRKLGVRYLDHLPFYALGCAGCALAWLSQIRKNDI